MQITETLLPYQKETFKHFKEEIHKQFKLQVNVSVSEAKNNDASKKMDITTSVSERLETA